MDNKHVCHYFDKLKLLYILDFHENPLYLLYAVLTVSTLSHVQGLQLN